MSRYVGVRLIQSVAVLVLATIVAFALLHLAGDPVQLMLGDMATPEDVTRLRRELGLDRPLAVQYWRWLRGAVGGDVGQSIRYQQPAARLVAERLPASLLLAATAMGIAVAAGVPLGILGALFRNSWIDHLVRTIAVLGQSIPFFWLALMFIVLFSVQLEWLPTSGYGTWRHLVMPAVTLSTLSMARIARLLRSSLLDVLNEDYVRTAHGKGLDPSRVVLRHALKNAALPVITVIALQLGAVFGGAVITETIFAWPGIGRLSIDAAVSRDYPLFQGIVVLTAITFVLLNLTTDLLYAVLDPRIRYSS
ncbi:MAG: ABC transporter permease [Armatimonadetes bacterium]|nr:ABC transporter permease [Armatimonadota bacterium]